MNKKILSLLLSIFIISCSEEKPSEPEVSIIKVSGTVFSKYSKSQVSDLEVTLIGNGIYKDTTDNEGHWGVDLIFKGQYNLQIEDSSYHLIDSTLFIDTDTIIIITIQPLVTEIVLSGQVFDNLNNPISGIGINADGEETYFSTTNMDGYYNFMLSSQGEYNIFVDDTSYIPFDTTMFIQKDTSLMINLSPVYILSGQVLDYANNPISGIGINVEGEQTYFSTTDEEGYYIFMLNSQGEYNIFVDDTSYLPFDTTMFIQKHTSLVINMSSVLVDYFPLVVGNWWSYSYDYQPIASEHFYHRQQGTLTWKIASIDRSKYYIEETIEGIEMNFDSNYDVDTLSVNKQRTIMFHYDRNGYITISENNHFGSFLYMEVNRFHPNTFSSIILRYKYMKYYNILDNNLRVLNSLECGYQVKLVRNIGMTELLIHNWSNGSPRGSFILTDYEIE